MGITDSARYIHEDKLFVVFQFNKYSGVSSTKLKILFASDNFIN